jgi:protein TonB
MSNLTLEDRERSLPHRQAPGREAMNTTLRLVAFAFGGILMPSALLAQTPVQSQASSSAPAPAGSEAPKPSVILPPDWLRVPSGEQINRQYPTRALRNNVEGRATLRCRVTDAGALTDCSVTSETPHGYGFGNAALKLSRYFIMGPKTVDGARVGGAIVNVPIPFRMH